MMQGKCLFSDISRPAGCKKKVKENEKSNTYSCDKCNRIYVANATGLCAKVLVSANNAMKTFTFLMT